MGRHSVIPRIEFEYEKPIEQVIREGTFSEAAADADDDSTHSDAADCRTAVSVTVAEGVCPTTGEASRKVGP